MVRNMGKEQGLGEQTEDGGKGVGKHDGVGEQNEDGDKGEAGEKTEDRRDDGGQEEFEQNVVRNMGKEQDGGKGVGKYDGVSEQNELEEDEYSGKVEGGGLKRGHSPEVVPGDIKKYKIGIAPKVNEIIFYLRGGKFVAVKIKKRVYKDKKRFWYNVEHLDSNILDDCIDLSDRNVWHYPEENDEKVVGRNEISLLPEMEQSEDDLLFQDEDGVLERSFDDSGPSPILRPRASSSPVESGEDPLSKMLEKNIDELSGDISEVDESLNGDRGGGNVRSDISLAPKTPFKQPSSQLSILSGSDQDL